MSTNVTPQEHRCVRVETVPRPESGTGGKERWIDCSCGTQVHDPNIVDTVNAFAEHVLAASREQAQTDEGILNLVKMEIENREAGVCPEDYSFEEYIKHLESRVKELESQTIPRGAQEHGTDPATEALIARVRKVVVAIKSGDITLLSTVVDNLDDET